MFAEHDPRDKAEHKDERPDGDDDRQQAENDFKNKIHSRFVVHKIFFLESAG